MKVENQIAFSGLKDERNVPMDSILVIDLFRCNIIASEAIISNIDVPIW
jgi:hypothetical protein